MTDFASPQVPAGTSKADRAVAYLLRRIQDDPRLAYYFPLTESLNLLTAAYAQACGLDADAFHREFVARLRTAPPLCGVCRNPVELDA